MIEYWVQTIRKNTKKPLKIIADLYQLWGATVRGPSTDHPGRSSMGLETFSLALRMTGTKYGPSVHLRSVHGHRKSHFGPQSSTKYVTHLRDLPMTRTLDNGPSW
uniref:Uncharacterized protein n=1 Tax=Solanum tuberosum TaxID=4113 RepID=M1DPJ5_SOLTU